MSSTGELVLRSVGLVLIVAALLTGSWAWRFRHRWGRDRCVVRTVGDGAYRRAAIHAWRARGTPGRVLAVGGLGTAWGLVTTLVLAPSGLAFLLAPARHEPARQILLTLSGLGVFATAIGGLALGCFLVRVSQALVRRDPALVDRALPVATWSTVHHGFVLLAFTLFAIHERRPEIVLAVAAPCAIGWAHAWSLAHVVRWATRLPEDAQDDWEGTTWES